MRNLQGQTLLQLDQRDSISDRLLEGTDVVGLLLEVDYIKKAVRWSMRMISSTTPLPPYLIYRLTTSMGLPVKLAHTIMLTSVSGSSLFCFPKEHVSIPSSSIHPYSLPTLFNASIKTLSASGYRPNAMFAAAWPLRTLIDGSVLVCPNSSKI